MSPSDRFLALHAAGSTKGFFVQTHRHTKDILELHGMDSQRPNHRDHHVPQASRHWTSKIDDAASD